LSGGGFEGNFGGVAEGIEEAEEKVGSDGLGVPVENGGDTGAGCTSKSSDLSVSEDFAADGFDDLELRALRSSISAPSAAARPSCLASSAAVRVTMSLDFFKHPAPRLTSGLPT